MDYEWQLTRLMDAAEAAFDDFEEQINQYNELSAAAGAQVTPLDCLLSYIPTDISIDVYVLTIPCLLPRA